MSTNTAPAGWHPDPSNPSGAFRWWDGTAWTNHTQPAFAAASAPYAAPGYPAAEPYGAFASTGGYASGTFAQAELSFAKQNSLSFTVIAVVAAYIAIAMSTHVVILGILPVMLSIRAISRKEPLAPIAVVAAIIAVAVAFLALK